LRHLVVIGCSLNALQYAYENETKFVLNQRIFPYKYEPEFIKRAWGLLYTKLMLGGQVIGGDTVDKVQVTDKFLRIVCEYNIINDVEYENIFIFNDQNILNLPEVLQEADQYKVIDVLKPISLTSAPIKTTLISKDSLVKELHIYKKTASSPIELFAVSDLTRKQLNTFDYSDTMVKFKSEELLKKNNFVGKSKKSITDRKDIELQVRERIIHKKMDIYRDTENIKFIYERI